MHPAQVVAVVGAARPACPSAEAMPLHGLSWNCTHGVPDPARLQGMELLGSNETAPTGVA